MEANSLEQYMLQLELHSHWFFLEQTSITSELVIGVAIVAYPNVSDIEFGVAVLANLGLNTLIELKDEFEFGASRYQGKVISLALTLPL